MTQSSAMRDLLGLVAITLILVATGYGLRDPWPADEPRFAMMARDMLSSGHWLFPMRGEELYPDKPPLFMWLQAIFIFLTGSVRFGFLLPALLSAIGMVVLVYDLMRRLWDPEVARLSVMLMLLIPQFVLITRSGQIDPVVCFWITLGFYGIARHYLVSQNLTWMTVGFIAMGLGVITKGVGFLPILMLPLLLLAYLLGWNKLSVVRTRWHHALLLLLAFALPIAAWLLPMLWVVQESGDPALQAYRDNILFTQTSERYAAPGGHVKPWWYYLGHVIPIFWAPLLLLLPWILRPLWRSIVNLDSRILIPLLWVIAVIAFFSFSPGKRSVYLAPLVPAVAVAFGSYLPDLIRSRSLQTVAFIVALLVSLLCLLLTALLYTSESDRAVAWTEQFGSNPSWIPAVIGGIGLLGCAWARWRRGIPALFVFFTGFWLVYGLVVYPLFNDIRSGRGLMAKVETLIEPGTELGMVKWKEQLRLQAQRPVTDFGYNKAANAQLQAARVWLRQQPENRIILLQRDRTGHCIRQGRGIEVGRVHRRDWALITLDDLKPVCPPAADSMQSEADSEP